MSAGVLSQTAFISVKHFTDFLNTNFDINPITTLTSSTLSCASLVLCRLSCQTPLYVLGWPAGARLSGAQSPTGPHPCCSRTLSAVSPSRNGGRLIHMQQRCSCTLSQQEIEFLKSSISSMASRENVNGRCFLNGITGEKQKKAVGVVAVGQFALTHLSCVQMCKQPHLNQSIRTNSFLCVSISTLVMTHLSTFIIKTSWTVELQHSFIYCKYRNVLFLNVGTFD